MSSGSFDGSTNGRGENRQKFLKEMMNLAPMVHASGILKNRAAARKQGFQNVEDAVNRRLDAVAKVESLRENEINGTLAAWLFGGKAGETEYSRLLPKWAQKRIEQGAKWPIWAFGYSVKVEHGKDKETLYDTTTVALYRFWRLKLGQRFIWGGVFHAGIN